MRAVNAMLAGAIALAVSIGASTDVGAQSLRAARGPVGTPPPNFTGRTFVDSRGCVYIRAGFGGTVSWVPQVTRARKQVCGFKPTAGVSRTAKSKGKTTVRTAVKAKPPKAVTTASVATPTKVKRKKANWNWFGTPRKAKVKTAAVKAPVAVAAPKVKTRVAVAAPLALRASGNSRIRTTPQAVHPADYYNGRLGGAKTGAGQTVQVARVQPYKLPKGYKSLLVTDAAPARRGVGTAQGQAQMDLLWTQTTPRRLIDVTTGRDMTTQLPKVVYPYTTVTASTRSFASATSAPIRKKHKKKRPVDAASPLNMTKLELTGIESVSALDPTVKSTVPKTEIKVKAKVSTPAAYRFIQVATFGVPANASRTMTRFNAGGIPTVSRSLTRKGTTYAIVMLGPFADDAALKAALVSARGAGFSDAFYVK